MTEEALPTVERIRNAESTIATAQTALDKAQAGLAAAEEVVLAADRIRRQPAWIALGAGITTFGLILAFVLVRRNRQAD